MLGIVRVAMSLHQWLAGVPGITVFRDGHHVSRISDFIMYSVEAEFIDNVVEQYGPCEYTPTGRNVFS